MTHEHRLWGSWAPVYHASGSCLVVLESGGDAMPHLYVFADPLPGDRQRAQRNRRVMCRLLAEYLSGTGPRPLWLDDFYRRGHNAAESLTGAMILSVGPWLPRSGQSAGWMQDAQPIARRARRLLIRTLLVD